MHRSWTPYCGYSAERRGHGREAMANVPWGSSKKAGHAKSPPPCTLVRKPCRRPCGRSVGSYATGPRYARRAGRGLSQRVLPRRLPRRRCCRCGKIRPIPAMNARDNPCVTAHLRFYRRVAARCCRSRSLALARRQRVRQQARHEAPKKRRPATGADHVVEFGLGVRRDGGGARRWHPHRPRAPEPGWRAQAPTWWLGRSRRWTSASLGTPRRP